MTVAHSPFTLKRVLLFKEALFDQIFYAKVTASMAAGVYNWKLLNVLGAARQFFEMHNCNLVFQLYRQSFTIGAYKRHALYPPSALNDTPGQFNAP